MSQGTIVSRTRPCRGRGARTSLVWPVLYCLTTSGRAHQQDLVKGEGGGGMRDFLWRMFCRLTVSWWVVWHEAFSGLMGWRWCWSRYRLSQWYETEDLVWVDGIVRMNGLERCDGPHCWVMLKFYLLTNSTDCSVLKVIRSSKQQWRVSEVSFAFVFNW